MELSTEFDLSGVSETSGSVTEMGQAIEGIIPLAQRMSEVLGRMEAGFANLAKVVDDSAVVVETKTKETEQKKAEQEQKRQEEEEKRESANLQSKMASMVGGGVNTAAYEIQLKKVKDQIDLINEAQEKRLITDNEAENALKKLNSQQSKINREAAAYHAAGEGWTGRIAAGATAKFNNLFGSGTNVVKGQAEGVVSGVSGLLKGLPFLSGGLFGLLLGGIMNTDKIRGETAELVNIARVTSRDIGDEATKALGAFQQKATHLLGISKGEFQGVYKTFTEAGISFSQVTNTFRKDLGEVGTDLAHLSFGMDKMLKLASGSSAKTMVSLTVDYGLTGKAVGEEYMKLAFAGQKSGIGTQNFINYVMQGAGALRQYGVSVSSVASVLQTIQEKYEQLGMPKQLAGSMAGESLQGIASGLGGMSAGMQSYFGEKMGLGSGLEGRQKFREGMERLGKPGGEEFFENLLKKEYELAMRVSHGNRAQAIEFLDTSQHMGYKGAKALMSIGEDLLKGKHLSQGTPEQIEALKKTFENAEEEQGKLAKDMYNITQGLAGLGQGILGVLTNLLGLGIVGLRWVWATATGKDTTETVKLMGTYMSSMKESLGGIVAGAKQFGGGIGDVMNTVLKPAIDAATVNLDDVKPEKEVDIKGTHAQMQKNRAQYIADSEALRKKAVAETGNPFAMGAGTVAGVTAFEKSQGIAVPGASPPPGVAGLTSAASSANPTSTSSSDLPMLPGMGSGSSTSSINTTGPSLGAGPGVTEGGKKTIKVLISKAGSAAVQNAPKTVTAQ
jgi:hypothetical protein